MIKSIIISDIKGLNALPPVEWMADYEAFLKNFISEDFFYAFVMIQDDKIIGTGNVLLKDKIAWLANIIMDERFRGKGFGQKMTEFLVDFSINKECETQLLVATELGESVYRKVGFKKISDYQAFHTEVGYEMNHSSAIRKLTAADLKKVYTIDQEASGQQRAHLIHKFYSNGIGYFNDNDQLLGFYLPDFSQGLVVSQDIKAGLELLKIKHAEKGRKTLIPFENQDGIKFLEQLGLKKGVKSARMFLGKEYHWNPKNIYAIGGGYCG